MKADHSFPVGPDAAFKFGCGRFRMEAHLLERCAEEVLRFGRKPLFVCNDTTCGIAYEKVASSLRSAVVEPVGPKFEEQASGDSGKRVQRGGNYNNPPDMSRSAKVNPKEATSSCGYRLICPTTLKW